MERTLTVSCPGLAIVLGAVVLLACGGGSDYCRQRDNILAGQICYQPDPRKCSSVPGCTQTAACIPRNCSPMNPQQCGEDGLCIWVEPVGCRPSDAEGLDFCFAFKDPESCATSEYCVWDVACDGDPVRVNCGDLEKEACDQESLECVWQDSDDSNEMSPWGIIGL